MTNPVELITRHQETLQRALTAIRERSYWSAYSENLKAYGPEGVPGSQSAADGKAAFDGYLGKAFPAKQAGTDGEVPGERSPYGIDLEVTYPHAEVDTLLAAAQEAVPAWRDAGPEARAGVALEILARVNARSHEIAQAVMHTSGQGYAMAFQAGGPHAQDRALEAVAYAYAEMTRHTPEAVVGEAAGQAAAPADDEALHGRPARRRPGHRLQHVPDVELLPRACSPAWSPATPSSSSHTPEQSCRSPSRWPSPARSLPRTASPPTW